MTLFFSVGVDSDFSLALLLSALARRKEKVEKEKKEKGGEKTGKNGRLKKEGKNIAVKELKLILMSATIATDKFALYLGKGLLNGSKGSDAKNGG